MNCAASSRSLHERCFGEGHQCQARSAFHTSASYSWFLRHSSVGAANIQPRSPSHPLPSTYSWYPTLVLAHGSSRSMSQRLQQHVEGQV